MYLYKLIINLNQLLTLMLKQYHSLSQKELKNISSELKTSKLTV